MFPYKGGAVLQPPGAVHCRWCWKPEGNKKKTTTQKPPPVHFTVAAGAKLKLYA